MKDVLVLNKIRGLKINAGEYIEYDPYRNKYKYFSDIVEEKENIYKSSSVFYEFPLMYIDDLVDEGILEYVGEDKEPVLPLEERVREENTLYVPTKRVFSFMGRIFDEYNMLSRFFVL